MDKRWQEQVTIWCDSYDCWYDDIWCTSGLILTVTFLNLFWHVGRVAYLYQSVTNLYIWLYKLSHCDLSFQFVIFSLTSVPLVLFLFFLFSSVSFCFFILNWHVFSAFFGMFESVLSVCTKFVQLLSLFVTLDSGLCRWHGSGTFPWQRLGVFFTRKKWNPCVRWS